MLIPWSIKDYFYFTQLHLIITSATAFIIIIFFEFTSILYEGIFKKLHFNVHVGYLTFSFKYRHIYTLINRKNILKCILCVIKIYKFQHPKGFKKSYIKSQIPK